MAAHERMSYRLQDRTETFFLKMEHVTKLYKRIKSKGQIDGHCNGQTGNKGLWYDIKVICLQSFAH